MTEAQSVALFFVGLVWSVAGVGFYMFLTDYVTVSKCSFYKKFIIRFVSGPCIMVFTFVPDTFDFIVSWLKKDYM